MKSFVKSLILGIMFGVVSVLLNILGSTFIANPYYSALWFVTPCLIIFYTLFHGMFGSKIY